eukprot:1189685-Prorocentrum_minimum.AAC.1
MPLCGALRIPCDACLTRDRLICPPVLSNGPGSCGWSCWRGWPHHWWLAPAGVWHIPAELRLWPCHAENRTVLVMKRHKVGQLTKLSQGLPPVLLSTDLSVQFRPIADHLGDRPAANAKLQRAHTRWQELQVCGEKLAQLMAMGYVVGPPGFNSPTLNKTCFTGTNRKLVSTYEPKIMLTNSPA